MKGWRGKAVVSGILRCQQASHTCSPRQCRHVHLQSESGVDDLADIQFLPFSNSMAPTRIHVTTVLVHKTTPAGRVHKGVFPTWISVGLVSLKNYVAEFHYGKIE
ncbi:hypothetical protein ACQ4PT_070540 [Festuca glaucescens]